MLFCWTKKYLKFNEDFIKNYNENGNIGYFLEVDIDYIETEDFLKIFLMMLRNDLIRLTVIKMIKDLFQQEKIKKYQVFLKMNWGEK